MAADETLSQLQKLAANLAHEGMQDGLTALQLVKLIKVIETLTRTLTHHGDKMNIKTGKSHVRRHPVKSVTRRLKQQQALGRREVQVKEDR